MTTMNGCGWAQAVNQDPVVGFDGFTYERITPTPRMTRSLAAHADRCGEPCVLWRVEGVCASVPWGVRTVGMAVLGGVSGLDGGWAVGKHSRLTAFSMCLGDLGIDRRMVVVAKTVAD